jgi:putative flippase GtrA
MLRPTKYLASAGVLTALGAIAPLWVLVQGDPLGAAIIAIPSALVLAICFGVAWTYREG